MKIYRDLHALQAVFKQSGTLLTGKLGDHHTADIESLFTVRFNQAEYVRIISNAQISAYFVLFNVFCTDGNDDLSLTAKLLQQPQLAVRRETGKDP